MNNKSLIYGFVGLVAGTTITGLVMINRTQAETKVSEQNTSTQTQAKPPVSQQDLHHPQASPTTAPSPIGMMNHQQADQHFIQMMIPHHQGAVDMANLALIKAKHPEVKKLAQSIKIDQNREIEQMKAWYKQWYGTEVPASSGMGMSMPSGTGSSQGGNQGMPMNPGMGMMGMGMMNMMPMDLEALKNAPDFDKAFIEKMITHHKMAVMMAGMVLDSEHPEMRSLAKNIIQTQSVEIEQMRQWNQTWYR